MLLQTARAIATNVDGSNTSTVRILFDSGSQRSYIKRGYGCGTKRIDGTDMRIKRGADMRIKRGADMRIKRGADMRIKRGWVVFLFKSFSKTCYGT